MSHRLPLARCSSVYGRSSLNVRDLMIINGEFPMPVPPGRVPLSDGAGEVVAVGVGVTRFKVGDRVINSFFPNWFGGAFNAMPEQWVVDRDGWLTEYKAVSAEALVAMPGYLTFEEAATLPCVAVAAWSALSGVRAGKIVLTQGAGGERAWQSPNFLHWQRPSNGTKAPGTKRRHSIDSKARPIAASLLKAFNSEGRARRYQLCLQDYRNCWLRISLDTKLTT